MNSHKTKQNSPVIRAKRQQEIVRKIAAVGVVGVNELSEEFQVAEMTIRRDLDLLVEQGLIERTHGGAKAITAVETRDYYAGRLWKDKKLLRREQKHRIGSYAAGIVESGDTIFVNSGSTTLAFLEALTVPNIKVISNHPFAPVVVESERISVISTGGELRRESYTLLGEAASRVLMECYASKAFIGVDGISCAHGLTTPVQSEAWMNRIMIEHTNGPVFVLADSSKIGKASHFLTAPIDRIDKLVTDNGASEAQINELRACGVEVIVVGAET